MSIDPTLEAACERVLIDSMSPRLKGALDKGLANGMSPAELVRLAMRQRGRRDLVVLAVEAYLHCPQDGAEE